MTLLAALMLATGLLQEPSTSQPVASISETRVELPLGPWSDALARFAARTPLLRPELDKDRFALISALSGGLPNNPELWTGSRLSIFPWRPGDPLDADAADTWSTWRKALGTVNSSNGGYVGGEAHTWLCGFAMVGGRYSDAWSHLVGCERNDGSPVLLLPRLTIGCDEPGMLSGFPRPLSDGVVLRPALPPGGFDEPGMIRRRAMTARGFQVGEAVLEMEVKLEIDGVEINVKHLSGGACTLSIVLPEPPELAIALEYVDWERQELPAGRPLKLTIKPGDEVHTLWGRFEPRTTPWPARLPESMPAQVRKAGLEIVTTPGDEWEPRLRAFAAALHVLFDVPCELRIAAGEPPASRATLAPLSIDLSPGPQRALKFNAIVSLAERWALREPK